MLETIYNKLKNTVRKIDMKIQRLKYGYVDKLPKDIKYFEGSLYDAVYEASCKWPHNTALEYSSKQITYKEMIKKINKVARALKACGVEKGDKVTICMPNTPEEVYMFYAVSEVGAIANMIHPLSSEKEIEDYLNQSDSKLMLCIDVAYPRVEAIIKNTNVKQVVVVSATRSMDFLVKILYWLTKGRKNHVKQTQKIIRWDYFLLQANKYIGNPHARVNNDDTAVILYSGGTTGKSKGVMLSNLNFNAQALISHYAAPDVLNTDGSFLTFLPNFHCFGVGICTHVPLYWGMRVILIPQFSGKKMRSYIRKYHFTVLCGVPTLFDYMMRNKYGKNELKDIRAVISGGDAMSLTLKRNMNKFLRDHGSPAEVRVGYGLTEASGVAAFSPLGIKNASDIIGYAMPNCEFYIRDLETDREARLGKDGEILIAGPILMQGYLNNEEATEETFITIKNKKYLKTGDIGFIDEKGLLHFKARLKRMIITNGYNVYPSQVEEAIMKCSAVDKCAVIGVEDPAHGENVRAFIVFKEGKDNRSSRNELQKILRKELAKYEIPREYRYVADLPLTKMNKIDFKALEQLD